MNNTLADGRVVDLLDTPFDQYQRYNDIRLVIDTLRTHLYQRPLKILDVGGTPLSKRFLPNDVVSAVNLELGPGTQLQCDGSRLPYRNGSFDAVITVDTLEHVPAERRADFVAELLRVASGHLIITGPFANGYNETAEKLLNDYLLNVLGLHHRFLNEHLMYGLPDLQACQSWIAQSAESLAIPSGYVQHWLPLMIIKHDLQRVAGGQDISDEIDRYYNYAAYWSDHRLPSYRQVIVAAKAPYTASLSKIQKAFPPVDPNTAPDLNGVVAMWQALQWPPILQNHARQIAALQTERDRLQNQIEQDSGLKAELDKVRLDCEQLRIENQRLSALVTAYQSGRFMRFMAGLKQLRSALR